MYLLDTNVVSELRKVRSGKAAHNIAKWADSVDANELFISVVTVQELEIGVLLVERRNLKQGSLLRTWLHRHVLPAFDNRILSVDVAVALRSAQLHIPDPRPVRDGMIAATALVQGMTVVTRNKADFEPTRAATLNPWLPH
jgi:predicted nucleic acid-binding protein